MYSRLTLVNSAFHLELVDSAYSKCAGNLAMSGDARALNRLKITFNPNKPRPEIERYRKKERLRITVFIC